MNTTASATVNDVAAKFIPATRPAFVTTPVVASVTVTVPLSRDDLVAVLFYCHADNGFETDATRDDYVRQLIADTVVNVGLTEIDATLGEVEDLAADDPRRAALEFCRRRVTELFPDAPAGTRRPNRRTTTATVRELVNA